MRRELKTGVERDRERVVLRLAGDLDLSVVPRARARLVDAERDLGGRRLEIDVAELTFADSTALGLLLDAQQRATSAGVELVVWVGDGPVRPILEMAGVLDDFSVRP